MKNPFENMGLAVSGAQFVGRSSLVKQLRDQCTSADFFLVGMPSVGKSSLAVNSVLDDAKEYIHTSNELCTYLLKVDTYETPDEFFKSWSKTTYKELLRQCHLKDVETKLLEKEYSFLESDDFDKDSVKNFFAQLKHINVKIITILDRFDYAKYIFKGNDFAILRACLNESVKLIATSRNTISTIEEWQENHGQQTVKGSLLKHSFTIKEVKPYDADDLEQYWIKFETFLKDNKIDINIDDSYKEAAMFYTNGHPWLLDVYNKKFFDSVVYESKKPNDEEIRVVMKESFDSIMKVLEQEELKETAISAILGPADNIKQYLLDELIIYGFLQKCTKDEKRKLIGTTLGLETDDAVYIGPSDYFTILFKYEYWDKPKFDDEWEKCLSAIRSLFLSFSADIWGEEWWNNEKFPFYKEIKNNYESNRSLGIPNNENKERIADVQEKYLFDFIQNKWNAFSDIFLDFKLKRFCDERAFLFVMRNKIYGHFNYKNIEDENIDKAISFLRKITKDVDHWLLNRNDETIRVLHKKLMESPNSTEGIVEISKCGTTEVRHVNNVMLHLINTKPLVGCRVRINHIHENNNDFFRNNGYPYYAYACDIEKLADIPLKRTDKLELYKNKFDGKTFHVMKTDGFYHCEECYIGNQTYLEQLVNKEILISGVKLNDNNELKDIYPVKYSIAPDDIPTMRIDSFIYNYVEKDFDCENKPKDLYNAMSQLVFQDGGIILLGINDNDERTGILGEIEYLRKTKKSFQDMIISGFVKFTSNEEAKDLITFNMNTCPDFIEIFVSPLKCKE